MQMRITWTPLPADELADSAANYYLRVFWLATAAERPRWSHTTVDDVRRSHVDVPVQNYTEHLVRVRVRSRSGAGSVWLPQRPADAFGWPTQGRPERAPAGLRSCANATGEQQLMVCLEWDDVEEVAMRGKLLGYRVYTWRDIDGEANGSRQTDQRVHRIDGALTRVQIPVDELTDDERGAGAFFAQVAAVNERFEGPSGEIVRIERVKGLTEEEWR